MAVHEHHYLCVQHPLHLLNNLPRRPAKAWQAYYIDLQLKCRLISLSQQLLPLQELLANCIEHVKVLHLLKCTCVFVC